MDHSLDDVLEATTDRFQSELHTIKVGRVVKYDSAKMTADIQIDVKRPFQYEDGSLAYEDWPVLPSVPIVFPRTQAYAITFPLVPGDTVILLCQEDSIGEWRQGNQNAEPADTRRHSLGYCVAIPGLLPDSKVTANAAINALVLGVAGSGTEQIEISSDGIILGHGATKTLAFGPAFTSLLNALITFCTTLSTSTPTAAGAASTLSATVTSISANAVTQKVKAL